MTASAQPMLILVVLLIVALAIATLLHFAYRARLKRAIPLELAPSKFAELSDCQIHYIDQGQGPVVILLHGIGASVFSWRKVFYDLSKQHRVIALDLPGFGKSSKNSSLDYGLDAQANRLIEFLNLLNIREARLVGSSMGGTLALWLAKQDKSRFPQIVCIAPATNPKLAPAGVSYLHWSAAAVEKALTPVIMKLILKRVSSNKDNHSPKVVNQYLSPYLKQPEAIKTFLKANKALRDKRLPLELQTITTPVLILWGQQDKMVPEKYMKELKHTLSLSQLQQTNGGHHLMEDQPSWVSQQTLSFFSH